MLTKNEKRVLRYVMVNYSSYPSINKIAKECKITPNGAYKILKKFEWEKILKFKQISNIKSYYLDFKNNKTKNIMELALSPKIIEGRIKYRAGDLEPLKKITKTCVLFGSYTAEKKEPNDLDVLFVFDKKNYKEYKKISNKIKEICPVAIHDVIQTKQDLVNNIKKRDKVIMNILENGIFLWGQSIIVKVFSSVS